ncbi:hypothetical protein AAVH_42792, partial [Aphelenchoides avenae]
PRKRSPSKPRSKSVSSASRKRPASKGRKPASRQSTPPRKASPAKRRASPSKSPGRKTAKSPALAKKTPSTTPAKSPASTSRSASRGRKPTTTPAPERGRSRSSSKTRAAKTEPKTTTITTKVEKKPSYTPPASSGLRPRRAIVSSDTESSRRVAVSDALRSRATSAARGRKGTGIVQHIVALPKRAWNAVRVPNAGRRLKRHVRNNWKKYLLFFVAFVALSVAYHFSRELSRSVEQLRTQFADLLEHQKKVFGDAIESASRKVEEWTETSNKSQSEPGTATHEHHHQHVHAQSSPPPRQQPVTPPPGGALPLDDAI